MQPKSVNIHYHVGLNNCAAKNSRNAVHVYALDAKIHRFLVSVQKDLRIDWEITQLVDFLYSFTKLAK